MREWFRGLSPAQRRLTVLFLSICLATLPFYALSFARLTAASAGLGAEPTSPDPGQLASEEIPSSLPTPTATTAPAGTAVPTEAAPSPEPRRTSSVRQLTAELQALLEDSVRAAWSGDQQRDFQEEIDEVVERLNENQMSSAREKLHDLADQAADLERSGDLERRLAGQIIAQLQGLANRL